jgi:cobalt-zinc-cadmium efflux system membrane fusion protein
MTTGQGFSSHPAALAAKRQWAILGVIALAALIVVLAAPWLGGLLSPKPQTPPATPPAGTFAATDEQWATLKFAQARSADVQAQLQTEGKIAADDDLTTQVFSPYSGRVTRVLVKAGDAVKAGQPLFEVQASEITQGLSDLDAASAQAKLAQANEARLHALYQTAGAPLKDWQQSQSDLAAAQATLQAARGRLKILGKSDAQIESMETSGGSGAAMVSSPIKGVATQRLIGVGQMIGSVTNGGSSPAFVISDPSKVWLTAQVREADSALVHLGQTMQVRVMALPGRVFQAQIDYVAPSIDPATRRLAVRGVLDNPDGALKPEMFAGFSLGAGPQHKAVLVPEDAVIFEGDTARVWVAHPADKTLALRQIVAGSTSDGQVQVLSGLNPGEWVVTSGSLFIDRADKPD